MRSIRCKIFGHKPYQGKLCTSFDAKVKDNEWQNVKDTVDAVICARCREVLSPTPAIRISMDEGLVTSICAKGWSP